MAYGRSSGIASNRNLPNLVKGLGIVGSGRDDSIAGHGDILDNDDGPYVRGDPDPCCGGSNTAADLEKVVCLSGGAQPGASLVDADFKTGSPTLCIYDLGGEPVLRNTALHVDLQITADIRARDVVPGDIDYTGRRGRESSKCIREEIEVVRTASWALVDNLNDTGQRHIQDQDRA